MANKFISSFKNEIVSLVDFIKKPRFNYKLKKFNSNIKSFFFVFIIDFLVRILILGSILSLEFFVLDDIYNSNKLGELLNQMSLMKLSFFVILILPVFEELAFRFHLKYRGWVINLLFIILLIVFVGLIIKFANTSIAITTILISFLVLIFYIKYHIKITSYIKHIWNVKFNFIFYFSILFFAFSHITNYEYSFSLVLMIPLIILPQLVGGVLIGYLRLKLGFIWGVTLHIAGNMIIMLPIIVSMGSAFPSSNINNSEYNLTLKRTELKNNHTALIIFSKDSIKINNCRFKKCLSLLLDIEENKIKFDNSFLSGGVPSIKSEILLQINYKNKSFLFEKEKLIFNSKQNILNELKKAYKFELSFDNDIARVEF